MKPLLRWTIGGVSRQGLAVFRESVVRTMAALGPDAFDWMVCYNNMDEADLRFVRHLSPRITLHRQSWADCPIPDKETCIKQPDGTILTNCKILGGSMWKLCPPRMRPDAHEIVIDNDVVLFSRFPALDEFLGSSSRTLLLQEPGRFLGRYDSFFDPGECYNSGLIGLPPGYDFAADLYRTWENLGGLKNLSYADEQGLITFVLKHTDHLLVDPKTLVELHHNGFRSVQNGVERNDPYRFTGQDPGIHFVESNRLPHGPWRAYRTRGLVTLYDYEDHS